MKATPESIQLALWSRDEAITRAGQNANPDWMDEAGLAVFGVALVRPTFTTDDIWEALQEGHAAVHEPRAMGAVMIWAVKQGYCVPTSDYQLSKRRRCHARPLRVWQSRLFPDARTDMALGPTKELAEIAQVLTDIKALMIELVEIQVKMLEQQ